MSLGTGGLALLYKVVREGLSVEILLQLYELTVVKLSLLCAQHGYRTGRRQVLWEWDE